jgi:hypothetical protein
VVRTTSRREGVLHGRPRAWPDRSRVYVRAYRRSTLTFSLRLFLSTKVQLNLADIGSCWILLGRCQWWIWALDAGKNLARKSGPKTFQPKVQIEKSAIEQIMR